MSTQLLHEFSLLQSVTIPVCCSLWAVFWNLQDLSHTVSAHFLMFCCWWRLQYASSLWWWVWYFGRKRRAGHSCINGSKFRNLKSWPRTSVTLTSTRDPVGLHTGQTPPKLIFAHTCFWWQLPCSKSLKTLSKMHSAFNSFAQKLSQVMLVKNINDHHTVEEVLTRKEKTWEQMVYGAVHLATTKWEQWLCSTATRQITIYFVRWLFLPSEWSDSICY